MLTRRIALSPRKTLMVGSSSGWGRIRLCTPLHTTNAAINKLSQHDIGNPGDSGDSSRTGRHILLEEAKNENRAADVSRSDGFNTRNSRTGPRKHGRARSSSTVNEERDVDRAQAKLKTLPYDQAESPSC